MRGSISDYDTLASRLADYEWSDPESEAHEAILLSLIEVALRCGFRPGPGQAVSSWAHNRLRTLRGNSDPSFSWAQALIERSAA